MKQMEATRTAQDHLSHSPLQSHLRPAPPGPAAIRLVQESFGRIPDADLFTAAFYERLFHLRPEVRPLFPADLVAQRQKLSRTLAVVVQGLASFDTLRSPVEALGRAHVGYGVAEVDYAAVGAALLWSLETQRKGLTAMERQAWVDVYGFISTIMMQAARSTRPLHGF